MHINPSPRSQAFAEKRKAFMADCIYPNERTEMAV